MQGFFIWWSYLSVDNLPDRSNFFNDKQRTGTKPDLSSSSCWEFVIYLKLKWWAQTLYFAVVQGRWATGQRHDHKNPMLVWDCSLRNILKTAGAAELFYFTLSQYYAGKLCKSTGPNMIPELSKENIFQHENITVFIFMPQGCR